MKYFYSIILGFSLLVAASILPAAAQKRVALVIGNSSYKLITGLTNPKNDATLMATALRRVGFEVLLATDVDVRGMSKVVRQFGKKLRTAGKDTVGLFYYAGHGVAARGTNYLIPIGAEIETESDLELESMSASSILAQMVDANNALNLVILDACRNNPYKGKVRSSTRGLARITTASGALIAFSAAPGQVAADGDGVNSPYTKALVSVMETPGVAIEQIFKKVRVAVEATTGGQQSPWEESSLRGDFYFVPGAKAQANNGALQPQVLPRRVDGNTAAQTEALFWKSVKDSRDPKIFAAYLEAYPNGTFVGLAKVLMNNLLREVKPANVQLASKPDVPEVPLLPVPPAFSAPPIVPQTSTGPVPPLAPDAFVPPQYVPNIAPNTQTAHLQPPVYQEVPQRLQPQYSVREHTLILQSELTRLGCRPGIIDGQWGPKGRRALRRFKRYAGLNLAYDDLSLEMLDAVKQQRPNLCPAPAPARIRVKRQRVNVVRDAPRDAAPLPDIEPERTYGRRKTSKKEWQDCVINSITPDPIVSGDNC